MSDYPAIAERFVQLIAHACERVEVGGSIRRGKPDPKDVEVVCVPVIRRVTRPRDMFTDETVETDVLDELLRGFERSGLVKSRGAWGPKAKRLVFEGAPVDLFAVTPPAQWGVIFAIRTGPAEFGKLVVTQRRLGGAMPVDKRVAGGALWHGGQMVETPEEEDYFREVGIPCWPPHERTALRLARWLREQASRPERSAV